MAITIRDVEYIARLARLKLKAEEKERFAVQLAKIVEYVEHLKTLNTEKVEPTAHILPIKNVTRPDEAVRSFKREQMLDLAPNQSDGFFKVPQIIE